MPNIATNHAITYTNVFIDTKKLQNIARKKKISKQVSCCYNKHEMQHVIEYSVQRSGLKK